MRDKWEGETARSFGATEDGVGPPYVQWQNGLFVFLLVYYVAQSYSKALPQIETSLGWYPIDALLLPIRSPIEKATMDCDRGIESHEEIVYE